MSAKKKDPTEPIRLKASQYPVVDEGTACTQSSFKTGKKAFLYIGPQGGRYKAMFKLKDSMSEAITLAKQKPDRFEVGSTAWVTARFSVDEPMPTKLWTKWLDESYGLSVAPSSKPQSVKTKTSNKKKAATKKQAKQKTKKKTTAKAKGVRNQSAKRKK